MGTAAATSSCSATPAARARRPGDAPGEVRRVGAGAPAGRRPDRAARRAACSSTARRRMHPDVCGFVVRDRLRGPAGARAGMRAAAGRLGGPLGRAACASSRSSTQGNARERARGGRPDRRSEVRTLLDGGTVTGGRRTARPLEPAGVLVVTPYNAQVQCLRAALPAGSRPAPSTSSRAARRRSCSSRWRRRAASTSRATLDFLFSRNRLNVAVSRARCLAVLVASERLLDVRCRTVEQMRLVNALCRFVELAEPVAAGRAPAPAPV